MKIALLQTGKTTDRNISQAADDYTTRLKRYVPFEVVTITDLKNTRSMPEAEQKTKEGKKILQSIAPDDYVVLLDERGTELKTVDFAELLRRNLMLPKKRLVFIIGGAWGFSAEVYERADYRLSLSKMTFPHQMVRLLFLEQLYRAFTVIKGEPYHHD